MPPRFRIYAPPLPATKGCFRCLAIFTVLLYVSGIVLLATNGVNIHYRYSCPDPMFPVLRAEGEVFPCLDLCFVNLTDAPLVVMLRPRRNDTLLACACAWSRCQVDGHACQSWANDTASGCLTTAQQDVEDDTQANCVIAGWWLLDTAIYVTLAALLAMIIRCCYGACLRSVDAEAMDHDPDHVFECCATDGENDPVHHPLQAVGGGPPRRYDGQ